MQPRGQLKQCAVLPIRFVSHHAPPPIRMLSTGGGGRSTIGAKSLGTQFKESLNNLLGVVNLTHPHYVR